MHLTRFPQLVRRGLPMLFVLVVSTLQPPAPCAAEDAKLAAQETSSWRSRLVCGRNSLYLFLKCHGYRVAYTELQDLIPLGERGSSFGDLHRAAAQLGADVDVLKTDVDRLAAADLPAIVLLESAKAPSGHFVVLADVDETSVLITDPTSTSSARMPRAQFQRSWSGYAMTHRPTPLLRTATGLLALTLGGAMILPGMRQWRRRRVAASAALLLALLPGCDAAHVEARATQVRAAADSLPSRPPRAKRPLAITYYGGLELADLSRVQLDDAVGKCRLAQSMSVSNLLHMIRLQGVVPAPAARAGAAGLNAAEVLSRVLNHDAFERAYGGMPYIVSTPHGVRFSESAWDPAMADKRTREAHVGQTLSILAELGVPLDAELTTPDGNALLADVVEDALANFTWDQELYWIAEALVMYLPPERTAWENKFGASFSFDSLAERLLIAPPGAGGPCGGTHAMYALAIMLQAQRRFPGVLNPAVERRIERYMQASAAALGASQAPDGSWTSNWAVQPADRAATRRDANRPAFAPPAYEPIWITGHVLECQVALPGDLRVSEARLTRAAAYILTQMGDIPPDAIQAHACAYTHGIHAIEAVYLADGRLARDPTPASGAERAVPPLP